MLVNTLPGDAAEIELKLRISPADIAQLRCHPSIRQYRIGPPITRKLTSIYYDTPDLQLLNTGLSLRIRRMSGKWFQSVKSAGHVHAGLHRRLEWEDSLSAPKNPLAKTSFHLPDFDKIGRIPEPYVAALFANPALRSALRPIFTTAVKRTEWQLATATGQIEMALDVGHLLIAEQIKADICEVELELKNGETQQLFAFAEQLKHTIPLIAENISKAELGYAFYR